MGFHILGKEAKVKPWCEMSHFWRPLEDGDKNPIMHKSIVNLFYPNKRRVTNLWPLEIYNQIFLNVIES